MKVHVLIRFGRWNDIIAMPLPPDPGLFCVTTSMIHYAKAVAHAARGNVTAAEERLASSWQPPLRCRLHVTCSTTPA